MATVVLGKVMGAVGRLRWKFDEEDDKNGKERWK